MKILCGLGNPGLQYELTRHNAGFLFLDFVKTKLDFPEFKIKWGGLYSQKTVNGDVFILLKPLSFMNLSGSVFSKYMEYYKCSNSDSCIIYDDVDLELGSFRIRQKGSAGTHNGMKSILSYYPDTEIPRLRLGIESRLPENTDESYRIATSDFVLQQFSKEELIKLEEVFEQSFTELQKSLAY